MPNQISPMATNTPQEPVKPEFIWDQGNIKHVTLDHPERNNTIAEVEHIFADPNFTGGFDRLDTNTGEPRYWGVGLGTANVVKYVAYVIRNGKIRPITCYEARRKHRHFYHEQASTSRGQEDQTGD